MTKTDPLPLDELTERISTKTYLWIKDAIEKEEQQKQELKDEALESGYHAFVQFGKHPQEEEDSEDEEERVREWISSSWNLDGIGGYPLTCQEEDQLCSNIEENSISAKYILSDKDGGHGDDLWAASRYIANVFANRSKCCAILDGLRGGPIKEEDGHPLLGLKVLELGAGGGLPSWVAMKVGAEVVCTDQSIPDRIRCLAECAQRNLNDLQIKLETDHPILAHAKKARVCPYNWGSITDELMPDHNIGEEEKSYLHGLFDVVIAADCVYIPQCHAVLLDSIHKTLSEQGVALLPFALHGNTKDENVWAIFDLAKEKGFSVDILESVQLTPQAIGMEKKRGLVNMVRLKKLIR